MAIGRLPQNWRSNCMELLKLAVRLPVIFVLVVGAVMGSWVAFWFIVRAAVYIHERYLSSWWR